MESIKAMTKGTVKQGYAISAILSTVVGLVVVMSPVVGSSAENQKGVASSEASQQLGQQGLGLETETSSPIVAGPEIIIGSITKIKGDEYTIEGDRGQNIRIRVTTDTNKVCPLDGQSKVSSGQEGVREHTEVPPTSHMQQQSSSKKAGHPNQADDRDRKDVAQHAGAPPTKDPASLKATMGSTDPQANEDVARGSGFKIGQCAFKVGDHVRVEASDMGTATTIKQLASVRGGQ